MTCEYKHCRHKDGSACQEYDGHWYHEDCFKEKQDVKLMLSIWKDGINRNVRFGDFYKQIYSLLERYQSDYLLFCIEYAIDTNRGLKHPAGLKFYIDKPEFKDSYEAQKKRAAQKEVKKFKLESKEPQQEIEQTFTPQVDKGFSAILGN